MRWLVTRHPGALIWAMRSGIRFDRCVGHLDTVDALGPHDEVYGILPVNLAAEVCARGARYFALCLHLEFNERGAELTMEAMERAAAHWQEYVVQRVAGEAEGK